MRYVLLWLFTLQLIGAEELPWTTIPAALITSENITSTLRTWYRLAALGVLPKTNGFEAFAALKTPKGIVIRGSDDYWLVSEADVVRLDTEPTDGIAPDAAELATAGSISRGLIAVEPPLNPKTVQISTYEDGWILRMPGTSRCVSFSKGINHPINTMSYRCGGHHCKLRRIEPQAPVGSG